MDALVSFVVVKAQQFTLLGNNTVVLSLTRVRLSVFQVFCGLCRLMKILCRLSVAASSTVITLVYPVLKCLSNF